MSSPPQTTSGGAPPFDPSRVARCFDGGADAYEETVWRNRRGAQRLVDSLPIDRCEHAVDVGCGTGFASVALIERFRPRAVTGVDVSAEMLERFRASLSRWPDLVVAGHQADVVDMPLAAECADVVISSMAFHWFPDRAGAIRAMTRALRPGGVLGILAGCEGTEEEYRRLLLSLGPSVPPAMAEAYETAIGLEEMTQLLRTAGLEPIDVWVERRRRVTPPERFLERTRLVAGHLIAGLEADRQEEIWGRIGTALAAHCGSGDFTYHFHKLYATARRP